MVKKTLRGYDGVALIKIGNSCYAYALYERHKYSVGDTVIVTGRVSNQILTIHEIINIDEINKEYYENIVTEEIKGKVDLSDFDTRMANRLRIEKLKEKMDERIKQINEKDIYKHYAKMDSELATLFNEYENLVK